jgi:hypothetical protein
MLTELYGSDNKHSTGFCMERNFHQAVGAGMWSQSRRLGLETYLGSRLGKFLKVSVSSRSRGLGRFSLAHK